MRERAPAPAGCGVAEDAAALAVLQRPGAQLAAPAALPGPRVRSPSPPQIVQRAPRRVGSRLLLASFAPKWQLPCSTRPWHCPSPLAVRSEQVASLYERFRKLDREKHGVLTKKELMMVPELAMNPLADRLVDVVLAEGSDGAINFRDFLRLLACFHVRSDASLARLFQLFDEDGDGMLSRADLRSTIRLMVGPGPEVGADGSSSSKQKVVVTDNEVDAMVDSTAEALGITGGDDGADLSAFLAYARACGLDKLMRVRVAVGTGDDEDEDEGTLGH